MQFGIVLDDDTLSSFVIYHEILKHWNSRINLVSRRDMSRFAEYHVLDSLKVASVFDFSQVKTMMDFGSGAGLPGIPLALAFPHITVTLVDSREKRCSFLSEACKSLPSLHARAIRSRIESMDSSFEDSFDIVITRATVSLKDFYLKASRFIKHGGSLISIKGDSIDDELSSLKNAIDNKYFSFSTYVPKMFCSVRQGNVVFVSRL